MPIPNSFWRAGRRSNVLMTGAGGLRGHPCARALLTGYQEVGLRVIEIDKHDPAGYSRDRRGWIAGRPEKFILFCDDLSFEAGGEQVTPP